MRRGTNKYIESFLTFIGFQILSCCSWMAPHPRGRDSRSGRVRSTSCLIKTAAPTDQGSGSSMRPWVSQPKNLLGGRNEKNNQVVMPRSKRGVADPTGRELTSDFFVSCLTMVVYEIISFKVQSEFSAQSTTKFFFSETT